MKKLCGVFISTVIITLSFTSCGASFYDGSRWGNKNQLIMTYSLFNTADSQTLELEKE